MRAHSVFYRSFTSKRSPYYILCGLIILFVGANIIASHSYPALMYGVMEGDPAAMTMYLTKIKGTPLYTAEMNTLATEQNTAVTTQMQQTNEEHRQKIAHLKAIIAAYPYAPEAYYNLSLVYASENNTPLAQYYMQKAQAIDPTLK